MQKNSRVRAFVKLGFWTVATALVFAFAIYTYSSGQMASMYFHKAKANGYAINERSFANATVENPVALKVENVSEITGPQAVPVKQGDVLPKNATGVIDEGVVKEARRVALENGQLKVMIPTEVVSSKGLTTIETFRLKNIETNPAGGVWNLLVVMSMGLCLGLLAESFTDVLGIKVSKASHAH